MVFNLKIVDLDPRLLMEISWRENAIRQDKKNLENYDFLAQLYLAQRDSSVAEFLIDELKWQAFQDFLCFDEALLKNFRENPFSWKTNLFLRLTFDSNIEKLENFYQKFNNLSIKKASKSFLKANKLFAKPYLHHLLEILFKKSIWKNIKEADDLMEGAEDYMAELWAFVKNRESLVQNVAVFFKLIKLLTPVFDNESTDYLPREKLIYTSFLTAMLACLHRAFGSYIIDSHLALEHLQEIYRLWDSDSEDFIDLLEELWDARQKQ